MMMMMPNLNACSDYSLIWVAT